MENIRVTITVAPLTDGPALIGAGGRVGPTIVIFGEPGDNAYIGAHALSALRLRIDPARQALAPAGPIPAAAAA